MILDWLFKKNKKRELERNAILTSNIQNKKFKASIMAMNDTDLAFNQYQNLLWYNGDSDMLGWFYTQGIVESELLSSHFMQNGIRKNYEEYYWSGAYKEKGVKRTHSGLPKIIIDTLDRCLGNALIQVMDGKEINFAMTKELNDILEDNNFIQTNKTQRKMTSVIGDGAFIVNIDKSLSDKPIIEYVNGMNCQFEYVGDKICAVITSKIIEHNGTMYELFERRSTIFDEGKRKAKIEYSLFRHDTKKGYVEEDITSIPETENLVDTIYHNIPFMLAIPCMISKNQLTNRGESLFKGKIEEFDDFDQNISQETNIMKAITPVEYVDENLLDRDKDGNPIKPSCYGKQYVIYKGAESYNQAPNQVNSVFYNVDFTKLTVESQETLYRCLAGLISPATLGISIARNDNAMAQREKEKITLQTIKELKEYEAPVIKRLANVVLAVNAIMRDENADIKKYDISVKYKDFSKPTLSELIASFKDALLSGAMSPEKYVEQVYGEESIEEQQQELDRIKEILSAKNGTPTFSLSEV